MGQWWWGGHCDANTTTHTATLTLSEYSIVDVLLSQFDQAELIFFQIQSQKKASVAHQHHNIWALTPLSPLYPFSPGHAWSLAAHQK